MRRSEDKKEQVPYVMFIDNDTTERRWLETASWEEEYQFIGKNNGVSEYTWVPTRWIN